MAIVGVDISDLTKQDRVTESLGSVSSNQLGTVMAQTAKTVASENSLTIDEMTNVISETTGLGKYGLKLESLESAGYIKPGTVDRFASSNSLSDILSSPSVWTGKDGVSSVSNVLNNSAVQTKMKYDVLDNGLSELKSNNIVSGTEAPNIVAGMASVASDYGAGKVQDWLGVNADSTVGKAVTKASEKLAMDAAARGAQYATDFVDNKLPGMIGVETTGQLKGAYSSGTAIVGSTTAAISALQSGNIAGFVNAAGQGIESIGAGLSAVEQLTGNTGYFDTAISGNFAAELSSGVSESISQFNADLANVTETITGTVDEYIGDVASSVSEYIGEFDFSGISGSFNELADSIGGISVISDAAGNILGGLSGSVGSILSGAIGGAISGFIGNFIGGLFGGGGSAPITITPPAVTQTVNRSGIDSAIVALIGNPKVPVPNYTGIVSASSFQLPSLSGFLNQSQQTANVIPVEVCSCSDPTIIAPNREECEAAGGRWVCNTLNSSTTSV